VIGLRLYLLHLNQFAAAEWLDAQVGKIVSPVINNRNHGAPMVRGVGGVVEKEME